MSARQLVYCSSTSGHCPASDLTTPLKEDSARITVRQILALSGIVMAQGRAKCFGNFLRQNPSKLLMKDRVVSVVTNLEHRP